MVEMPSTPATVSWQKSTASGGSSSECVQVTRAGAHLWIRDSKDPHGPILELSSQAWTAFLGGLRRDEFTL